MADPARLAAYADAARLVCDHCRNAGRPWRWRKTESRLITYVHGYQDCSAGALWRWIDDNADLKGSSNAL